MSIFRQFLVLFTHYLLPLKKKVSKCSHADLKLGRADFCLSKCFCLLCSLLPQVYFGRTLHQEAHFPGQPGAAAVGTDQVGCQILHHIRLCSLLFKSISFVLLSYVDTVLLFRPSAGCVAAPVLLSGPTSSSCLFSTQ